MATDSALELDGQAEDWHCQQVHRQGDEEDADDIEAKATLDHLADLDVARAIGNGVRRGGNCCLLYTSPSPRDKRQSRMPSSA